MPPAAFAPTTIGLGALLTLFDGGAVVLTLTMQDRMASLIGPPPVSVSGDGQVIAFVSYARLLPGDTNVQPDIYVFDRGSGRLTLESVTPVGHAADGASARPSLDAEGRHLAFESTATNLTADASNGLARIQVFVRDRALGRTRLLSRGQDGYPGDRASLAPRMSGDGRTVVFESGATNLLEGTDERVAGFGVFTVDVASNRMSTLSPGLQRGARPPSLRAPCIDHDGNRIAFVVSPHYSAPRAELAKPGAEARAWSTVWVHESGRTARLVSRAADGALPNGHSWSPAISADGRFVAFVSEADNIVPSVPRPGAQVYVADLNAGVVTLVSRRPNGRAGSGASLNPAISGDGSLVVFQSLAADLECERSCADRARDINLVWDVFLAARGGEPGPLRLSGRREPVWLEPSVSPTINARGQVIAFSSRHPVDADDTRSDTDLYVVLLESRPPTPTSGRPPGRNRP